MSALIVVMHVIDRADKRAFYRRTQVCGPLPLTHADPARILVLEVLLHLRGPVGGPTCDLRILGNDSSTRTVGDPQRRGRGG
jgi:hypothetical protein